MRAIKRREFLTLGVGATATALLSQCARRQPRSGQSSLAWLQAQVYSSQDGLLSFDLEAKAKRVQLGNGTANLLTYNGQVPGPRLEASPGDTVRNC